MVLGRYDLTTLQIGEQDVPLTSGKITRGADPKTWDAYAEGVPQETFDRLWQVLGPGTDKPWLRFVDATGEHHAVECIVGRRTEATPGFDLSDGILTFSFEGHIK